MSAVRNRQQAVDPVVVAQSKNVKPPKPRVLSAIGFERESDMPMPRVYGSNTVVFSVLCNGLRDLFDLRRLNDVLALLLYAVSVRDPPTALLFRVVANHPGSVQFRNLVTVASLQKPR